jgi:hypothetical protein
MKETSSIINKLNGDTKLNNFNKIIYIVVNIIENIIPSFNKMEIKNYTPQIIKLLPTETRSPSRLWCDLFWEDFVKTELIQLKEISAAEFGCGSGKYALLLNKLLGDKLSSYLGFDVNVNKQWERINLLNKKIKFKKINPSQTGSLLQGQNLLFTQSAIEHFQNDLSFFKKLNLYVEKNKCLQIHFIPSPFCLFTYLFHGYRQYNLLKIKKIISQFKSIRFTIYTLGGFWSNYVHLKWITLPTISKYNSRKFDNNRYKEDMLWAINKDLKRNNSIFTSTFLAVIIRNDE